MENLRYMLAQYNPNTAFYFGHRYILSFFEEGYMAGEIFEINSAI